MSIEQITTLIHKCRHQLIPILQSFLQEMLKRRRRIQKYINALKSKKENLSKHTLLHQSLTVNTNQQGQTIQNEPINQWRGNSNMEKQIVTTYQYNQDTNQQYDQPLWHDSDEDQEPLQIQRNKNVYKKLSLSQQTSQKQYQGKLKSFYEKKYKLTNWAQVGDGEHQLDIEDYLDQQQNYDSHKKDTQQYGVIKHFGRTTEKHSSIVTGMDWYGKVLFTCGYDQKVKIFKVNDQQDNPDLKIKLEKDILLQKLPVSSCFYNRGQLYCGTLRKNIAIIDPVKEKVTYFTSSFLSDHKKYENLRVSKQSNQKLIFSGNKISILDYKNSYTGSLLTNSELRDVKFGKNPYELFGVTNDQIYEWDLRNYKPYKIDKTYLGYSTLEVSKDYICTGSRLGMIYINQNIKDQVKPFPLHSQVTNLTTTITHLSSNKDQTLSLALSKWKQNSARIIDINKGKCIGNWPTPKTNIQFGTVGSFCGDSDMFSIGSSNGFINIFNFDKNDA